MLVSSMEFGMLAQPDGLLKLRDIWGRDRVGSRGWRWGGEASLIFKGESPT